MTRQKNGLWSAVAMLSVGVLLGVGGASWMTPPLTIEDQKSPKDTHHGRQIAQLEKAVTELTQSLQNHRKQETVPEPCAAAPANAEDLQESIARLLREEFRQALAQGTPESQRARAEEIAIAQALNSPENRAAYQNAADIAHAAIAAGRFTEDDAFALRAAVVELTNEQRMEILRLLAPALEHGTLSVEVVGPLF